MGNRRYSNRGCGCGIGCGCGCCRSGPIAKLCLALFSTVFLISGGFLIYFGIWAKAEKNFVSLQVLVDNGLGDSTLSNAGFVIIAFGAFVVTVSAFGFLAVLRSSKRLAILYGFSLFVIFCCGIAAAIAYGKFNSKIGDGLSGALIKSLKDYQEGSHLAKNWDNVQTWIGCCGSAGPKDYTDANFFDSSMHVPVTCCILTNSDPKHPVPLNGKQCQLDAKRVQNGTLPSSEALHLKGCFDSLEDYIESKLVLIIGLGVGISILQLLGICLTIGLCRDDNDGYGNF